MMIGVGHVGERTAGLEGAGSQPRTIGAALGQARRERMGLEAQLLLARALDRPRSWVLAHPEFQLSGPSLEAYRADLERLQSGVSLPYLLGQWEFYGRQFLVGRQALIPRPETELLVQLGLELAGDAQRVLDLGTGCGCVAVSLALEMPGARVVASDRSLAALRLASRNLAWHRVENRVRLVAADLFDPLTDEFDLICANLPYLPTARLTDLPVARSEPRLALDGGVDGLRLIRRALRQLPTRLAPGGVGLFEIDAEQAEQMRRQADALFPASSIRTVHDLAGHQRVLVIQRA